MNEKQQDALMPEESDVQPGVTIRARQAGQLVYEVRPDQLPTETIAHAGKRLSIEDQGILQDQAPDERVHYEVVDKISEGGMGLVYKVKEKTLRREVALKICRADISSGSARPQEVEEFTNEAYMTALLDHPGVVPIYALAKDAEGRPFFSMKKISGTCWKDLLHPETVQDPGRRAALEERARNMTWRDHIDILLKVCDAVAYAHSKAILHRDLKPENIMLGEFGEVYVMDWGLAFFFDERNEYKTNPGLKPQLAGTPYYIAPEMVRGEMTSLAPPTDVYLLGGILYELLTGRAPHDGPTVKDLLREVARGNSVVPPEEISDSPHITPPLSKIVMKALAPRIEERYPSVAEFQRDIQAYLAHSESMAISRRANGTFDELRANLDDQGPRYPLKPLEKKAAAIIYGQLSECIGGFQQAIDLWHDNTEARRGLIEVLRLQVRLALEQDDLTLARAQMRTLKEKTATLCVDEEQQGEIEAHGNELARQIEARQAALDTAARQARRWKTTAAALGVFLVIGLAIIARMNSRQRALAIRNEKHMFATAVEGRAQMLEQFMEGIELVAALYREEAVRLMSMPPEHLPPRTTTPAGRDGFYFDEDYYDPGTAPPDLAFEERYQSAMSMTFPTVVRSPWARDEAHRHAVNEASARLGRINTLFSGIHRTRPDIMWSLAGSEAGLLIGFPGSGRYHNMPEYDATQRAWYTVAIQAQNDEPVWGTPYADASTHLFLISCVCRIHVNERNVGVIGLEVTLESVQEMLLDFSRALGGERRCLLVRPFQETDPHTGEPVTVHRIVVDTLHDHTADDWQAHMEMQDIMQGDEVIAQYYQGVLAGKHPPGTSHEAGDIWLTHSQLKEGTWTLIAMIKRQGK